ncbi:MAG: hypothetical protein JXR51_00930 [Bacteroidales bacterium]|nr:hypothetical protein [Bacteroidales bacterium]MBN2755706.1 hypothetical protein [Bacteroidales bacterium]
MDSKKIIAKGINAINDKILNLTILISVIFSIPVLISSLYRISTTGFNSIFIIQIFLSLSLILLYFFKEKLNFNLKLLIFV